MAIPKMRRFLWTVGLGTSAFSMQDVLLEPFGGEILKLDVGLTSSLTALSAGGSLIAFLLSSLSVWRLEGRPVELAAADHEVDVDAASVAAAALELVVGHLLPAVERELVGRTERDVARGVLVK